VSQAADTFKDMPVWLETGQSCDMSGHNCSPTLPVEWIKQADIPFKETRHLLNACHGKNPVHLGRSGQVMLT